MVACNRTIRQVFLFGPGKIPALFYFTYCVLRTLPLDNFSCKRYC